MVSRGVRGSDRARNFAQFCANRTFVGHFLRRFKKKNRQRLAAAPQKFFGQRCQLIARKNIFLQIVGRCTSRIGAPIFFLDET